MPETYSPQYLLQAFSFEVKLGGRGWGKLERVERLPYSAICFEEVTKLSKPNTAETGSVASVPLPSSWSDPHLKKELLPQLRLEPCSQGLRADQETILLELPSKRDWASFWKREMYKLDF